MEQKLIEAQFKKNEFAQVLFIVGVFLIVLGFAISGNVYENGTVYKSYGFGYGDTVPNADMFNNYGKFLIEYFSQPFYYSDTLFVFVIYMGALLILLPCFFWWEMSKCELSITDRRVVGKASFGKVVDLPLNQISAVALGMFSRITVATSSGKVHFWFIQNRSEVHSVLTNIIGKVQVESAYPKNNTSVSLSNADELKKFKELLDNGIITQDEFDEKKKQLLDL